MTIPKSKIADRNSKISLTRNALQHLLVRREFLHEHEEPLDCFPGFVAGEAATDQVDLFEFPRLEKQFLAAGPGKEDVHCRVNALIADFAIEDHLHVAGALEFLEDELVHSAAGLDERGRHDGERASFLGIAG